MSKTVAETILAQLGGQRFIVMTGAKHLMSDDSRGRGSLSFRIPGTMTKDGVNFVRITLSLQDTYTVEIGKVRGLRYAPVKIHGGIMADQLRDWFTENTGLDTHL